jgi:hypothetical protein
MKTTTKTLETLATRVLEDTEQTTSELLENIEAAADPREDVTLYHKAARWAAAGGYIISSYDARELLATLYGQTEAEAAVYTDDQVWRQYIHLMGRALARAIERGAAA